MRVYCCSDLIFATKIRSTAEAVGAPTRPAREAEKLGTLLEEEDVALVLVDLELDEAESLIRQAKDHASQPRVIAFGAHVARERLQAAEAAGADRVMPRSTFTQELPELLQNP